MKTRQTLTQLTVGIIFLFCTNMLSAQVVLDITNANDHDAYTYRKNQNSMSWVLDSDDSGIGAGFRWWRDGGRYKQTLMMRLSDNGNLGIGRGPSLNPEETLHVSGNLKLDCYGPDGKEGNIKGVDALVGYNDIRFYSTLASYEASPDVGARMFLSADGKLSIGMGERQPDEKLHVYGNIKLDGDNSQGDISGIDEIKGHDDLRFSGNPNAENQMYLSSDGKLGIGCIPTVAFDVVGQARFVRNEVEICISNNKNHNQGWIGTKSKHNLNLGTRGTANILLDTLDNVVIGGNLSRTINDRLLSSYSLFVSGGGILSEDLAIASASNWADHVFSEDYDLKPLEEINAFIEENGHLPNIPSKQEVEKEGYSVHDMNVRFLEKIEELTLHIIKQEEKIKAMSTQLNELNAKLNQE
ncbi:hypothetical protein [Marinifilum caeruleilacunae]|uniref:Peptidase S74 domain-containing protein n=1 Tax=Marinifilum caeruleilacunae TaxID=2499076 RepID=A0ABX1WS16_9BACT|nr:hypothetical protein [Marinifilum caeruleilacunae]NOU58718.1 hypothetical protein [Marinifilum caeruleilacunae]